MIVLAVPHVFATLIAEALRARATYDVSVPDLRVGEWPHGGRYDAAITSMPVSTEVADVVMELPDAFDRPVRITAGGVTVELAVHVERPIEDALDALDRFVLGGERVIDVRPDGPVRPARPPASSP